MVMQRLRLRVVFNLYPPVKLFSSMLEAAVVDTGFLKDMKSPKHEGKCSVIQREGTPRRRALNERTQCIVLNVV